MPENPLTPKYVSALMESQQNVTETLRVKMQTDYDWYRLLWTDDRLDAKVDGYQTYISNEARTFAKRMMAWLTGATLIIRAPMEAMTTPDRAKGQANERFVQGILRRADRRLMNLFQPRLRDQLAFYIPIRGMFWGRALLVKQVEDSRNGEAGTMVEDISPFDPLHTYWGIGRNDLAWAIHHQVRSRDELVGEFGERAQDLLGGNHSDMGVDVFDYYDGVVNGVCTKDAWLKDPTPHYSPRIPIFRGVVGFTPPIRGKDDDSDQLAFENYGESIYDEAREIYDQFNKTMSDMMTLVRRSVKPPVVISSADGKKVLESDPYAEGKAISKRIEEKVETLDLLRMAMDTGPFLAVQTSEKQRAGFSHTTYGETPFQLSGYAINILGKGTEGVLAPRVRAMENAYFQIANLVREQYHMGGFVPVSLYGRGKDGKYFSQEFPTEVIDPAVELEVNLIPDLPQDKMQNMAMAQIAKKEGFLSTRTIQDRYLQVPDVDAENDMIKEEQAEIASPKALLQGFIESAIKRGRPDLVSVYGADLQNIYQQEAMQQQAAMGAMGGGVPNIGGNGGGGPAPMPSGPEGPPSASSGRGLRPEVLPNAMQGKSPPIPVPQGTLPLQAPGTPRPGARNLP